MRFFRVTIFMAITFLYGTSVFAQDFRNQSDEFMQIGYGRYKTLTFGGDTSLVPMWGGEEG